MKRVVEKSSLPLHELVLVKVVNLEGDVGMRTAQRQRAVLRLELPYCSVVVNIGGSMLDLELSSERLTREPCFLVLILHKVSVDLHLRVHGGQLAPVLLAVDLAQSQNTDTRVCVGPSQMGELA